MQHGLVVQTATHFDNGSRPRSYVRELDKRAKKALPRMTQAAQRRTAASGDRPCGAK